MGFWLFMRVILRWQTLPVSQPVKTAHLSRWSTLHNEKVCTGVQLPLFLKKWPAHDAPTVQTYCFGKMKLMTRHWPTESLGLSGYQAEQELVRLFSGVLSHLLRLCHSCCWRPLANLHVFHFKLGCTVAVVAATLLIINTFLLIFSLCAVWELKGASCIKLAGSWCNAEQHEFAIKY